MLVSELLLTIESLAKENGLSKPYIVGGLPRDRAFGLSNEIKAKC